MTAVTVCIPAYRAQRFIQHTLATVRSQSFDDYVVEIAVEPVDADATLAACTPFLEDPRFRVVVNPTLHGYAGNVRALLRRVRTPLFVVLPHDDAWHPRFLERMHAALATRPEVVCAYPDLLCFAPDGIGSGVVRPIVHDAELRERVISWLVEGASGNPWHGLTRSNVLGREFPANPYQDVAVECAWVLHLLGEGRVVRVAEPLYLKRQPTPAMPDSVSAAWVASTANLNAALDRHREGMLALMTEILPPRDRKAARVALEAAMLRRRLEFADGRWGLTAEQSRIAAEVLQLAESLRPDVAAGVTANVRWSLSRHWDALDEPEMAEHEARDGLRVVPDHAPLGTQLGWLLMARGAVTEAMDVGLRTSLAHPDDPHVRLLLRSCEERLEQGLEPSVPRATVVDDQTAGVRSWSMVPVPGNEAVAPGGLTLPFRLWRPPGAAARAAESRAIEAESRTALLAARLEDLTREVATLRADVDDAEGRAAVLEAALSGVVESRLWRLRRAGRLGQAFLVRLGAPNPLFDSTWYRATYPDVPGGRLRAWWHWRRHGWRDGRDPDPLFDTIRYLSLNPDVRRAGVDPLAHYLFHGSAEGRHPGPHFDARRYLERYPDVRAMRMEPLVHYLRYGAAEGRVIEPPDDRADATLAK